MKHLASALSISLLAAGVAQGQVVIDGTVDATYGTALSVQNTSTGFGDTNDPDPQTAGGPWEDTVNGGSLYDGGSEIDAVYGVVDNGYLNIFIAGNLEDKFNKLEIFIDSESGVGQNTIDGANLPVAVDAFCCGGFGTTDGALQRMNGLTFDADFAADYFLTISNGGESAGGLLGDTGWMVTAHWAELNNGSSGLVAALGGQLNAGGLEPGLSQGELVDQNNNDPIGTPLHEFFEPWDAISDPNNDLNHRDMENTIGLLMGVNNSNAYADDGEEPAVPIAGGVIGGVDGNFVAEQTYVDLAAQVTTGFEFAIPLSAIGNPTGDIKITAFINGDGHHYASNQFSGVGVLSNNLGGDGVAGFTGDLSGVDLSAIAGDQFVTISQGLEGDLNGDGFVGLDDLDIVLGAWNQTVPPADAAADPSGDGYVGLDDLDIVLNNWNNGTPPASVVPEPATLALLGLGTFAMLRRR